MKTTDQSLCWRLRFLSFFWLISLGSSRVTALSLLRLHRRIITRAGPVLSVVPFPDCTTGRLSSRFPGDHDSSQGYCASSRKSLKKMAANDDNHISVSTTMAVSAEDRRALWITYTNILLYALCYQLQLPVEPFLIKSLSAAGASAATVSQTYGRLQAFFSAIQTIGSPLVGILLDRVGIRFAFSIVFLSSALSYFILANATDMHLLFWSKIPTALQAAFLVAQATAATSTGGNDAARAQALGRMTTAYTVGATIGPAIGGYLAKMGDLYLGAKLAVAGSLLSLVLSLLFLPDTTKPTNTTTKSSAESVLFLPGTTKPAITTTKSTADLNAMETVPLKPKFSKSLSFVEGLQNTVTMALRANLWPLLVVKVVGGMAASMHSTALPLVLTQQLHFDPSQLGLVMSSSMFAVAAFGAVAMGPLVTTVGPPNMVKLGLLARMVLQALLAAVVTSAVTSDRTIVGSVIGLSVLYSLSSHTLATGLTTQTTGAVEKHEQGTLLGIEHSLFSLARIGSPPLATTLLMYGFWTVAMTCGTLDVLLVLGLILLANARQEAAEKKNKWP